MADSGIKDLIGLMDQGNNYADSLSEETRLRIAEEIDEVYREIISAGRRSGDSGGPPSKHGYLQSLIQSTLKEVVARGGFIKQIPAYEERSEYLKERIRNRKEELMEICRGIQEHEKLLGRDVSIEVISAAFSEDLEKVERLEEVLGEDDDKRSARSWVRAEIKSAISRARWLKNEIVTLTEKFVYCSETLTRLVTAASDRGAAKPESPESEMERRKRGKGSRMVVAEKKAAPKAR